MRQSRRIESDGIFNKQYNLYADTFCIVRRIHLVLDQFDDGQQQFRITEPAEYIVYGTQILIGNTFGHLLGKRRKDDDRDLRITPLDFVGCRKNIAVVHVGHADDQSIFPRTEFRESLSFRCDMRKARRITQIERCIFVKDLFVHTTIILQHECIVFGCDKKDVVDTFVHQTGKRSIFEDQTFVIGYAAHK